MAPAPPVPSRWAAIENRLAGALCACLACVALVAARQAGWLLPVPFRSQTQAAETSLQAGPAGSTAVPAALPQRQYADGKGLSAEAVRAALTSVVDEHGVVNMMLYPCGACVTARPALLLTGRRSFRPCARKVRADIIVRAHGEEYIELDVMSQLIRCPRVID